MFHYIFPICTNVFYLTTTWLGNFVVVVDFYNNYFIIIITINIIKRMFGTKENKRKANLWVVSTQVELYPDRNKGEGPNRKSNSSPGNDITPEFP